MARQYSHKDIVTHKQLHGIRQNAGMYITSNKLGTSDTELIGSQLQLIKEVIDNSGDEALISNKECEVIVRYLEYPDGRYQFVVIDQGRGIPGKALKRVFTVPHTTGKDKNHSDAYIFSVGTHGLGVKCTSAFSNTLAVVTRTGRDGAVLKINKLEVTEEDLYKRKLSPSGTTVFYEPDPAAFPEAHKFRSLGGLDLFKDLLGFMATYLPNMHIKLYTGKCLSVNSINKLKGDALWDFLNDVSKDSLYYQSTVSEPKQYVRQQFGLRGAPLWESPRLTKEIDPDNPKDMIGFEIELFVNNDLNKQGFGKVVGNVNMTRIDDPLSYHISGVHTAIKKLLISYIEDKNIAAYFRDTYKLPIHGSIYAKMRGAKFVGQTKDGFKMVEFLKPYIRLVMKQLSKYPEVLDDLYAVLLDDIAEKFKKYNNKIYNVKTTYNAFELNEPSKFRDCASQDPAVRELLIVEGESAGGGISEWVDKVNQAVMFLQGKLSNAFKRPKKILDKDKTLNDLILILGVTPGSNDLSTLRYHRIGIMADPDPDGQHIVNLILTCLYHINPDIIRNGHVFVINPPLYLVTAKGNGKKELPLRDANALLDMKIRSTYMELVEFTLECNETGKRIRVTGDDMYRLCKIIKTVGLSLVSIANRLTMEPLYIEILAQHIEYIKGDKIKTKELAKVLGVTDVIHHKQSGCIILVIGGIELRVSLEGLVEEIEKYVLNDLRAICWDKVTLYISTPHNLEYMNNQRSSICHAYSVFTVLDKIFDVTRIKGVGQVKPPIQRRYMISRETRTITNITSMGDVDIMYKLMGVDTAYRKKLLSNFVGDDTDAFY